MAPPAHPRKSRLSRLQKNRTPVCVWPIPGGHLDGPASITSSTRYLPGFLGACSVRLFAMAVLPPSHEDRLAALSINDELRSVSIDRDRILEGVGHDEALVDAMLARVRAPPPERAVGVRARGGRGRRDRHLRRRVEVATGTDAAAALRRCRRSHVGVAQSGDPVMRSPSSCILRSNVNSYNKANPLTRAALARRRPSRPRLRARRVGPASTFWARRSPRRRSAHRPRATTTSSAAAAR